LQLIINEFFNKYAEWYLTNCIVVNPNKSNYLSFDSDVNITINGHVLSKLPYVKYLGILFDDELPWKQHVKYVTTLCSQRIGLLNELCCTFLPVLEFCIIMLLSSPASHTVCYIDSIIVESGRYKLIDKIDYLITLLAHTHGSTVNDFVTKFQVYNIWNVHKLQSLSFMYDICNNRLQLPYLNIISNNVVHENCY
jgi:hypothetical protein